MKLFYPSHDPLMIHEGILTLSFFHLCSPTMQPSWFKKDWKSDVFRWQQDQYFIPSWKIGTPGWYIHCDLVLEPEYVYKRRNNNINNSKEFKEYHRKGIYIQGISLHVYQCHTLTSLQPPFLHGSPSAISFIPPFLLDPVGANIGLSEEARDGVSGIRGVFSKSGLVPLIVGSGDRCLVWPTMYVKISVKSSLMSDQLWDNLKTRIIWN